MPHYQEERRTSVLIRWGPGWTHLWLAQFSPPDAVRAVVRELEAAVGGPQGWVPGGRQQKNALVSYARALTSEERDRVEAAAKSWLSEETGEHDCALCRKGELVAVRRRGEVLVEWRTANEALCQWLCFDHAAAVGTSSHTTILEVPIVVD